MAPRRYRQTRSSFEVDELPQALARLETADPEVANVALIFRISTSRVFCLWGILRHEITAAELHNDTHRLSLFETGIENKSLIALNSRPGRQKGYDPFSESAILPSPKALYRQGLYWCRKCSLCYRTSYSVTQSSLSLTPL
jgi:hypothetical protein